MASTTDLARILTATALLATTGACEETNEPAPARGTERPGVVLTVNYPVTYFAARLAPEGVSVELPAPEDRDPAYWRPGPDAIAQYQEAGLILLNGAGYAGWAAHATLPRSRTVITARGCRERFLPSGKTVKHQHGPEGEHAHGDTAFTTWLDFRLALCQAANVRNALVALRPNAESQIQSRFAELEAELRALDDGARAAAEAWGDQPILASHPVYQYLADAYDLRITSLHLEPDQPLGGPETRTLDDALAKNPARLMLWEAPPLVSTQRALEARGVTVLVFDPAPNTPSDGDFVEVMRANNARLACATGAASCD